ncbi:NADPH-dependent FMN reductase [Nonomuraea roseoviolacea]|uniref:NAD(P)H-dependent FMN reductase n=1 Tax=Nonomuraea roseoviolacea subsp. carminata TaxID=160689 RepID=A0ABT1K5C5_9ACTN|nr:NAD(P)H-dependent oxidoreductase [Nonomuraea roseoviolacea]MCP2349211.1 NAD(P)H-dependent FMN reductase [Nonomuraea roseoviolacea subsp. carminata]
MIKVGIIIGSTRPGRNGEAVARWIHELATERDDASYEIVDLKDFRLPHLDEALPPAMGRYANAHTRAWAATIDSFDAYVFVTPEYNHSTSGVLKNAIDFLYAEWHNKAAAFVSYGSAGGVRAVEHLRLIMGELHVADVRTQVALSLATDFENFQVLTPAAHHAGAVTAMLDELLAWGGALRTLRHTRQARRTSGAAAPARCG